MKPSRRSATAPSCRPCFITRCEELCELKVKDFTRARRGVPHLNVSGKGEKTRYSPLHPGTNELIHDYLEAAGHGADENGAPFRPDPDQPYRRTRKGARSRHGLQVGARVFSEARL
jgi:integrase